MKKMVISEANNGFILERSTGEVIIVADKEDLASMSSCYILEDFASEEEIALMEVFNPVRQKERSELLDKIRTGAPVAGTGRSPITSVELRDILMKAKRYGADFDNPEGARYVKISTTLLERIVSILINE